MWSGSQICRTLMATMFGASSGTTPWRPWSYDERTHPPSMRSSILSGDHPQAPVVTSTTAPAQTPTYYTLRHTNRHIPQHTYTEPHYIKCICKARLRGQIVERKWKTVCVRCHDAHQPAKQAVMYWVDAGVNQLHNTLRL